MSLRDKLRAAAQGVNKKAVPVPEWAALLDLPESECEVEVRQLTVAMQVTWQTLAVDPSVRKSDDDEEDLIKTILAVERNERSVAALLVACCFEIGGDRIFAEEDVGTLMGLPREHQPAIDRLVSAAVELNAFGKKAVDDAVKNFKSSPRSERSAGSGSKAASRRRN